VALTVIVCEPNAALGATENVAVICPFEANVQTEADVTMSGRGRLERHV